MKWSEWADERLLELERTHLARTVRDFEGTGVNVRTDTGHELISFASNDYFGLTAHPQVQRAAGDAILEHGVGAGSARLIAGSKPLHTQLESELAAWKGEEAALLFSSGYAANLGVLTAFGTDGTTLISDELNHASIVDGCRLALGRVVIYPHSDLDHLRRLVTDAERPIVVTDLVFSMDGDIALIDDIAQICADSGALLIVDEAHAALGPHPDLSGIEHVRVGTLSKMLGSAGGFAAANGTMIKLLTNSARSFVFTTAGSASDVGAALESLHILLADEGEALRRHLIDLIEMFVPGHRTPIFTVPLHSEEIALHVAAELYESGFLVPAIRPPTVPVGTSRLRISLSAAHTKAQVEMLLEKLTAMGVDGWRR
jgi:8-amino-7-oxononanoate synthase